MRKKSRSSLTSRRQEKSSSSLWSVGDGFHKLGWSSVALVRSANGVVYYRVGSMKSVV